MGVNISDYDTDPIISGNERVIGTDDNGDTANYSINDIAAYAQAEGTGRMAIFDAALESTPYFETITDVTSINLPARLEFTGPRNDTSFFPNKYGTILSNQLSAPASSSIDFRFLPEGLFIEFDVEFRASLSDDSGFRLDREYPLSFEITYPNGDIERQVVIIPNEFIVANFAVTHRFKLTFSTYIKNVLTDSLLGGSMKFVSYTNPLTNQEFVKISDLIVRVKV